MHATKNIVYNRVYKKTTKEPTMATAPSYTNPFDKATETADWLDWECNRVHEENTAYRKQHGL
jgi:hypothetical protein